ncbi:methyltransferase [Sphaerisporangium melleum]|uniref:Methyltransferase n=1 Tax=Sphaerisporangium melleum TaxID=321316 RepID=A0A917RJY7_9ACTN|nr:acetylserotonin O-methyltransferase [Sphaerisporangium melleum]GGL11871.1 methyltransferase [Sphaerisporangium melleum]GII74357.1 methyltransferase [Sphaerisporangium melleum]
MEHELMRILTGGWVAQATFVAIRLGVPDALDGRRMPCAEIAAAVEAHPDALHRLLRLLAGVGLVEADEDGAYGLTPMGELLRRDRLGPLGTLYGEDYFAAAWGGLMHSVRTGELAFDHVHGMPVFAHLAGDPGRASVFNAGMAAGSAFFREVPVAYDFSRAGTVVDLAGGTGALLGTVLLGAPAARGVLFDTPGVVADAAAHLERIGVLDRCELVGGDLFDGVPAGGDVYLLSRILHDWDDDRCAALLRGCAEAMRPGAELLVIERVVTAGSYLPLAFDLHMMVMTGGRERTEAEYRALLRGAGLTPGKLVDLPLGMRLLTATR